MHIYIYIQVCIQIPVLCTPVMHPPSVHNRYTKQSYSSAISKENALRTTVLSLEVKTRQQSIF